MQYENMVHQIFMLVLQLRLKNLPTSTCMVWSKVAWRTSYLGLWFTDWNLMSLQRMKHLPCKSEIIVETILNINISLLCWAIPIFIPWKRCMGWCRNFQKDVIGNMQTLIACFSWLATLLVMVDTILTLMCPFRSSLRCQPLKLWEPAWRNGEQWGCKFKCNFLGHIYIYIYI